MGLILSSWYDFCKDLKRAYGILIKQSCCEYAPVKKMTKIRGRIELLSIPCTRAYIGQWSPEMNKLILFLWVSHDRTDGYFYKMNITGKGTNINIKVHGTCREQK